MFMRKTTKLVATAVLALAVAVVNAAPARADANPTPRPGASLGGRAAYFWPAQSDAGSGQWMGGAQLRFYLAKFFAVEGSADYRQQRTSGASTIADIYPVQVSGLLYLLPNSPVSPFALGGVGWYFTHVRGPNGFDQTSNRFGSHVGGGLQFFLSRHWSLDATYRYIFTDRITTTSNGARVSITGDGHMVTGGVNFHF
jgi:opacity protein-like surface antigen